MSVLRAEDIVKHQGDVESALQEKKEKAAKHLAETGSLPEWWEVHICVGKTRGVPPKWPNADAFYSQGWEYFEKCAMRNTPPTIAGLVLHLGFTNRSTMEAHVRRHPDFREAHSTFMTVIESALESAIHEPKGQAGKMFLLKNIPQGLAPDDPVNKPMEYAWKDKATTELTGANGGPLEISRKIKPEEGYLQMLEGGTLEPKEKEINEGE